MPWAAAAAVAGAAITANGASKASKSQAAGAQAGLDEEARQFDLQRQDLAPFMKTGTAANQRLSYLLGLGGSASGGAKSREQIRDELLGSYTSRQQNGALTDELRNEYDQGFYSSEGAIGNLPGRFDVFRNHQTGAYGDPWASEEELNASPWTTGSNVIDENGLTAAIEARLAQQAADQGSAESDPEYGSLLRKFTEQDFQDDPVRKIMGDFALNEGTKAINQRSSAMGGYDSGNTLKALLKYGADYGNQQAGASRDRFIGDQTNIFNRLSGISGTGQTAATQSAVLGQQTAGNISGIQQGLGNARGAAAISKGNIWGDTLGTIGGMFKNRTAASDPYSGLGYSNDDISGLNEYQGIY